MGVRRHASPALLPGKPTSSHLQEAVASCVRCGQMRKAELHHLSNPDMSSWKHVAIPAMLSTPLEIRLDEFERWKFCTCLAAYRRSRNRDPLIFNFGTRCTIFCKFYPGVAYRIKTDIRAFVSHNKLYSPKQNWLHATHLQAFKYTIIIFTFVQCILT